MSDTDPKAENLIRNIWLGDEFTRCDGNVYGYSNFAHILSQSGGKTDEKATFFQIIEGNFSYNLQVDYTFQHRYRVKSIEAFWRKEIFFAGAMILFFWNVNDIYRAKFMGQRQYLEYAVDPDSGEQTIEITEGTGYGFQWITLSITDEEDQLNNINEGYDDYQSNDMLLTFLCGSLLYTTLCKVLFNACQRGGRDVKVPYDLWTITDIFAAVYTMITFMAIVTKPPVEYLDADTKDYYDYLVSGLIVI